MSQYQSFSDFVAERERPLRRFATVLTGDPRRADEIVTGVLSWAEPRWHVLRDAGQPNPQLRQLIVKQYLTRRRELRRPAPTDELFEVLDAGDQVQAEREAVDRELAAMPRRRRAILVLRFYENMPDTEIAALLRCSRGTVRRAADRAVRVADDLQSAFIRLAQLTALETNRLATAR